MKRLILVEDTYGVRFHRKMINKILGYSPRDLIIERVPAKECNPAIERKVKAMIMDIDDTYNAKILIVLDSEGLNPDTVKENILKHFKRTRHIQHSNIRVVVVEPNHEAWLCIGLGYSKTSCRRYPKDTLIRNRGIKSYEKRYLDQWADKINIRNLQGEKDFTEYRESLNWLLDDP